MEFQSSETVELTLQLGASLLLVIICTMIHGTGLFWLARALDLRKERLERHEFNFRALLLMSAMGLGLFLLHLLEILIFAAFYLLFSSVSLFEEALHFSASTYATVGQGAEYFPDEWALMGSLEGLLGFLLIGWSTAFIVRNVTRLQN